MVVGDVMSVFYGRFDIPKCCFRYTLARKATMDTSMNSSTLEFEVRDSQTDQQVENRESEISNASSSKKAFLVSRHGVIGYSKQGEPFLPRTNFDVKVVGTMKNDGITVGYLFQVTRDDDTDQRCAFLSNTDCSSSGTILKVLNKCFNNMGLWIPTKDHRFDIDLPIYFQNLIYNYMHSHDMQVQEYFPVTVFGRQPSSDVWVLGKSLQINKNGEQIPKEDQKYVYEESLISRVEVPLNIIQIDSGPESLEALGIAMKDLLGENFISALFVLGGMVMSVHTELIYKHRKASAMVMAVGPTKCGKTTALNCAAAITGSKIWGTGTGFSVPSAMEQANGSTMGYCLDDVKDDKLLEEIVISTYNQGGYVNMAIGRKVPKCTPVMTSNFTPSDSRIVSRLAIIPFVVPKNPVRGMDRMVKERTLMDAMENAGRGIATIIKIGSMYEAEDAKSKLYNELTEFVLEAIGEEFIREAVNYAEVIGFTDMLCKEMGGPSLGDLQEYFLEVVVPHFNIMVAPNSSTNQVTLSDIQTEMVRLCSEEPKKAITVINPMVICNETKDKCIAISVSEFVKVSNLKVSESHCKSMIHNVTCVQAGCSKKHQAMFLQSDSKLPKYGPIIIKGKGQDKNSRLRWTVLMKRSSFKEEDLAAINRAFNTCNWPEENTENKVEEAGPSNKKKVVEPENKVEEAGPSNKKKVVEPEDKVEEAGPSNKKKVVEPEDTVEEPPSKKKK